MLVTGHTGFKGAWLALWLHRLGAQVRGLALPPPSRPCLFEAAGVAALVPTRLGDIRDLGTVQAALTEAAPEIVLHLAAQALVRPSYGDPVGTFATNVMGTAHVLEAARLVPGVKAVVVVTSDKCYENREWPWGYRENEAMGGFDPYSASKGCAELVAASYRRSFLAGQGVAVASARAGNVIGGGDWAEDRLVPDLIRGFAAGQTVVIRNPASTRPWQHVLEPLAGYLRLAQCLVEGGPEFADAWNFGPLPGSEATAGEVATALHLRWPDSRVDLGAVPKGPHEANVLKLDSSKAMARLGWQPQLTLGQALDWTVAWYRGHAQHATAARSLTFEQILQYSKTLPEESAPSPGCTHA